MEIPQATNLTPIVMSVSLQKKLVAKTLAQVISMIKTTGQAVSFILTALKILATAMIQLVD